MVPTGPIPGRTPIKVPTKHPRKQNMRFVGWKATLNPVIMLPKKSINRYPFALEAQEPFREGGLQEDNQK